MGSLYTVKGHIYLLEAVREVLNQGFEVAVVRVGRGELREQLDAQAGELGIQRQVLILGYSR